MIKKYFILIMEGALYGFFGGALLWISLYLIYETHISIARSQKLDKITMSYLSFPVKFLGLCLSFMILASFIRLIIGFFLSNYSHSFLSWLLTGMSSILVIYLIMSGEQIYFTASVELSCLCCLDKFVLCLTWLVMPLLIFLYTILFIFVKNLILRKREFY